MTGNTFTQGVKPGGLTTDNEIRILICYILNSVPQPVTRAQMEDVLLGEELVNYFAMAENLAALLNQGLVTNSSNGYTVTDAGRNIGRTLGDDVPRTVRDAAVRGVIRAQQFAANAARHRCEIVPAAQGKEVRCQIEDGNGTLFNMALYMPDDLTAQAVKEKFIWHGDSVYKLILAALTGNPQWADSALKNLL